MNQQEKDLITQVVSELTTISLSLKDIANGLAVEQIMKNTCVAKVTNEVEALDEKLNSIMTTVAIIKSKLNGSASSKEDHIWQQLEILAGQAGNINEIRVDLDDISKKVDSTLASQKKTEEAVSSAKKEEKKFWKTVKDLAIKLGPVIAAVLAAAAAWLKS